MFHLAPHKYQRPDLPASHVIIFEIYPKLAARSHATFAKRGREGGSRNSASVGIKKFIARPLRNYRIRKEIAARSSLVISPGLSLPITRPSFGDRRRYRVPPVTNSSLAVPFSRDSKSMGAKTGALPTSGRRFRRSSIIRFCERIDRRPRKR